ncbi:hypothetical protein LSM04_001324 [Trypanosoma melophagium]|uniref:uncharacterized protein n=1 Tax=Trypanosoma melophagium TaxID=715481 RepID=UPI00351A245A|nr:hypothetical protein LSM04_001324 [Trypanosoma melophagium]
MYRRRQKTQRHYVIIVFVVLVLLVFLVNTIRIIQKSTSLPKKKKTMMIMMSTHDNEGEKQETTGTGTVFDIEVPSDEVSNDLFNRDILPQCRDKWINDTTPQSGKSNYTIAKELQQRRIARLVEKNTSLQTSSWWTYDDILRDTLHPEYYIYNQRDKCDTPVISHPCDSITVPFNTLHDMQCIQLMQLLLQVAFASPHDDGNSKGKEEEEHRLGWHTVISLPKEAKKLVFITKKNNKNCELKVWVRIEPLAPSFEQRTIKFQANICFFCEQETLPVCLAKIAFIIKVPQKQFPTEPFAEVAAFQVDRTLDVRRVPVTFLFPIPLAVLQETVRRRSQRKIRMIPLLSHGKRRETYEMWLENDFFLFVTKHGKWGKANEKKKGGDEEVFTHRGGEEVWCSFQLRIKEVIPLLRSPLYVPYSKKKPGWHRWFNPLYAEMIIPHGSLAALSEQAMLDYIMGNNDRSPNKNSFVVGGSRSCSSDKNNKNNNNDNKNSDSSGNGTVNCEEGEMEEKMCRPSGMVPTILHVDHGLAFQWGTTGLVNNPLAKQKGKETFCIFYKPLLFRLWVIEKALVQQHTESKTHLEWSACEEKSKSMREKMWMKFLMRNISSTVRRALGDTAFQACGVRVVRLLQRANKCLGEYPLDVVLIP